MIPIHGAKAAPTSFRKASPELMKKLDVLDEISHDYGSTNVIYTGKLGPTVKRLMSGDTASITPKDLVFMLATKGPISSYKGSLPKSKQDPEVIEALEDAILIAKKIAPRIAKKAESGLKNYASRLKQKYDNDESENKLREKLKEYLSAKDAGRIAKEARESLRNDHSYDPYGRTAIWSHLMDDNEGEELDQIKDKYHDWKFLQYAERR